MWRGVALLAAVMSAVSNVALSEVQVAQAVQTLADYIVFGRQPARRDNFMHMDILTQFNYEDY